MDVAGILTMWRSLLLSLFCLPPPSVYSAILLLPSDLGLPSQEQTPLPSEDDPYDPGVEEGRSYYGGSTDGVVKEAVECVPDHSQVRQDRRHVTMQIGFSKLFRNLFYDIIKKYHIKCIVHVVMIKLVA